MYAIYDQPIHECVNLNKTMSCTCNLYTFLLVVDDGAILDVQFVDFSFPPPDGFDRIMLERTIL